MVSNLEAVEQVRVVDVGHFLACGGGPENPVSYRYNQWFGATYIFRVINQPCNCCSLFFHSFGL